MVGSSRRPRDVGNPGAGADARCRHPVQRLSSKAALHYDHNRVSDNNRLPDRYSGVVHAGRQHRHNRVALAIGETERPRRDARWWHVNLPLRDLHARFDDNAMVSGSRGLGAVTVGQFAVAGQAGIRPSAGDEGLSDVLSAPLAPPAPDGSGFIGLLRSD
jgi:hypothetical protein